MLFAPVLAAAMLLTSGVAAVAPVPIPVTLTVLNANREVKELAIQVEGQVVRTVTYGSTTRYRLRAATTTVTSSSAEDLPPIEVASDGCDRLLVAAGHGWIVHRSCSTARLPADAVGIRFVNATADAGTVTVKSGSNAIATAPGTATDYQQVQSAAVELLLFSGHDERPFRVVRPNVSAGTLVTVVLAGGGETPITVWLLLDAVQPPDRPDLSTPIETDVPEILSGPGLRSGGPIVLCVLCVLCVLIVAVAFDRTRRVALLMVTILLLAGCAETPAGGPAATSPPLTSEPGSPTTSTSPSPAVPAGAPTAITIIGKTESIAPIPIEWADALHTKLRDPLVGWFNDSSPLGEPGTTVLVGHVSWGGKPGAFADLAELTPGDVLEIIGRSGTTAYTVETITSSAKGALSEYGQPRAVPTAVLISCTGPNDPATGRRSDNIIVTATAEAPGHPAPAITLDPG